MNAHSTAVMIVGTDPGTTRLIVAVLAGRGLSPVTFATPEEALRCYRASRPAAVVLEPGRDGLAAVAPFRRVDRDVPILIVSADTNTLVEAVALGAADVLRKPLSEPAVALRLVHALNHRRVTAEVASLRTELESEPRPRLVVGPDGPMAVVARLIERAADTDATVLIQGEGGTGKDLVARAIHALSGRRQRPFVKVNCAGLPDGTLESELFGFDRGACSGAVQQKPGRVEFANHGTLFLDEIAAMAPAVQAKLLLVLQEGGFSRPGSRADVRVDTRLVAATSTDLAGAVAGGTFREDLYFRLNVVAVVLPPLRERRDDIPLLTEHFLRTFSVLCNKPRPRLSEETMRLLAEHEWPGNVRELEAIVRRLMVAGGEGQVQRELQRAVAAHGIRPLAAAHRAEGVPQSQPAPSATAGTLKEIARSAARAAERAAIFRVLQRTRWNRKAAAEFLGISYKALLYKIRENGLDKPAPTS